MAAKDIFRWFPIAACYMLLSSLLLSCSDNDLDAPPVTSSPIELSEQRIEISSDGRYYSVTMQVSEAGYSLQDICATTEADWIRLEADTISREGRLTFYVKPNTDVRSREGIIELQVSGFKSSSDFKVQELTIHQRSEAEDDANALNGDSITRKARVGYGYNMLIDYMNPECVTEPILDYGKLVQAEQTWGTIIGEEGRAQQSLSYHSSYSVEEMSSWMSKQTTTEVDFLFINKSVNKFKSSSEYDLKQLTFGYSSLSKVVATRYIDEGKVQSIVRQGGDIFTDEFRELYKEVNSNPTDANVQQLVTKFGTHLVTYADLGGRLDYSVNFRSEETSRESVERYLKYKNGKQKKDEVTKEASHAIVSSGDGLHFDIYGGSEVAINALENLASTKDLYGQVDPGALGEWLNSIKCSDPQSVSLVRCMMQPIWQLFTNQDARIKIINHILALAYSEAGEVGTRLQELGLDNYYQLNVTDEMFRFGNDANSTLAKIIYYDNLPKVEICNEYVPELRGDRRVTIFYPIFRQQTNIRRGFFLGDGENAPAEVTFDNVGGCYVRPLTVEGYHPGDCLNTLYYIDGAFYPDNIGINIPPYQMTVADEWLHLTNHKGGDGQGNYPVVKIGSTFWSRRNATDELGFGPVDEYGDYIQEEIVFDRMSSNSMLFANTFYDIYPYATNAAMFDLPGKQRWYIPTRNEVDALYAYLGRNLKSMMPGQMSGFEAQFAGYYGEKDLEKNIRLDDGAERMGIGRLCCIPYRNDNVNDKENGKVMLLKPDYTCTFVESHLADDNYYPVRPIRNKNYKHDNLE